MFLQTFADFPALASAVMAILCLSAWPLFQSRPAMLRTQLAALGCLVVHYVLVGAETAAIANLLGAVQLAACLIVGTRPRWQWIGYVLALLVVAASIATWQGMVSAFAAVGTVLVTVGRAQSSAQSMRILVLAGCPFWLVHDLLIASPIAIADTASLAIGLWFLVHPAAPATLQSSLPAEKRF